MLASLYYVLIQLDLTKISEGPPLLRSLGPQARPQKGTRPDINGAKCVSIVDYFIEKKIVLRGSINYVCVFKNTARKIFQIDQSFTSSRQVSTPKSIDDF